MLGRGASLSPSVAGQNVHTAGQCTVLRARKPPACMQVAAQALFRWSNTASKKDPRSENVAGDFYVDHTCIDCDTCRWMAPETFGRVNEASAVVSQPAIKEARVQALQALLSCPTHSIHVRNQLPGELKAAQEGLPAQVPGCPPGVYYTGWATEKSFAAASYLLVRPSGNILVDSPRYNPVLARRIEALGGIKYMFLTHRDDVGDHEQWAAHFGASRILHQDEVRPETEGVEVKLQGEGPWVLRDDIAGVVPRSDTMGEGQQQQQQQQQPEEEITFIHTPGHTRGHVVMLHGPSRCLFSGDHLAADEDDPTQLAVFTDFNWYSVPRQLQSVEALLQYDFLHILPGHGRRAHLRNATHRLQAVSNLLQKHGHHMVLSKAQ